jgi:hypothetical protein
VPLFPSTGPVGGGRLRAGHRYWGFSQGAVSTSGALGNGTLRVAPVWIPHPTVIDRLFGSISVVGEAGSLLRLVVLDDTGETYPRDPLAQGTIDGASASTQEVTIADTTLPRGWVFFGGAVQSAPTTQPTVRVNGASMSAQVPLLTPGTALPGGTDTLMGYLQAGVTGTISTFSATVTNAGLVPRVGFRVKA